VEVLRYRLRHASSIEDALLQIFPASQLLPIMRNLMPEQLVAVVADYSGIPETTLWGAISERLNLRFLDEIEAPDASLFAVANEHLGSLRELRAIPQRFAWSEVGWGVACAAPDRLNRKRLQELGVPLVLTSARSLAEAWKKWDWAQTPNSTELGSLETFSIIIQLALDAVNCGADEVFIGYPNEDQYEFLVGERRYQGILHPYVYRDFVEKFRESRRLTHPISEETCGLAAVHLSLARNLDRPVLCLTWDKVKSRLANVSELRSDSPPLRFSAESDQSQTAALYSKRRVLIVDDDERFLAVLEKILSARGWEVSSEQRSQLALSRILESQEQFDLVISDIHMPEMDGCLFLRELRAQGYLAPVLMLTSDEDEALEAELADAGADAFIRKHEDLRVLLAWANNLASRAGSSSASSRSEFGVAA